MSGEDDRRPNRGCFRKGQSGNPGGRPRRVGNTSNSAFDVILDRTLKASRGGVVQEVTVEEALQQRTYQEALTGKRLAIREVLRWILKREQWIAKNEPSGSRKVTWGGTIQDPDNADQALVLLGMAHENPTRRDVGATRLQLQLESWAVKAALRRRRGAASLTTKEIEEIRRCTHDDGTLKLPEGVSR
jgi:Family of unknown function (DUF5681)